MLPYVVYTKSEIDAWSTLSSEYGRLASSWAGNVARSVTLDYGAQISSIERDVLKDESGMMKVQAVLWAADNNPTRKDKVVTMLNALRGVSSWQWDSGEQYRLVCGWSITNVCQAAAIIGYRDPGLDAFLRMCYAIMDWPTNPNWHASFADSKLAIAAYLQDPVLWADAKAYYYERIRQSIYHASYDGDCVRAMHNEDSVTGAGTSASKVSATLHAPPGVTHVNRTVSQWGWDGKASQITTNLKAEYPVGVKFPNGRNGETRRDLEHVSMSLAAWMHGARTIIASGEKFQLATYSRLLAAYAYHGDRVYSYIATGKIPDPVPVNGAGAGGYKQGWYGAKKLFGVNTPSSVTNLLACSAVTTYPAAGANHMVAEAFADG